MKFLFTNAPIFVPGMKGNDYSPHDLERRVEEVEAKNSYARDENVGVVAH
jgi:hypothetical protein